MLHSMKKENFTNPPLLFVIFIAYMKKNILLLHQFQYHI